MTHKNHRKTRLLIASLAALTLTGTAVGQSIRLSPEKLEQMRNQRIVKHPDLKRQINLPRRPDLAVTAMSLTHLNSRTGRKKVLLHVTVKNVGLAHWSSSPEQQTVMAYAGRQSFLVSRNLKSLNAGASRTFLLTLPKLWARGWEFTPDLTAKIVFDPDIRLDGKASNDDANPRNNSKTIRGIDANEMVGR